MSEARYLADTGPLLCFGLISDGHELLADCVEKRMWHVTAVDEELRSLPTNNDDVAIRDAAASWRSSWLADPLRPDRAEAATTGKYQAELQAVSGQTGRRADLGEAQTIAIAESRDYRVLMCDKDATRLASEHNIEVRTPVDILRLAIDDRISLTTAWEHYLTITDHTFPGEHLSGPLDLEQGWIDV